MEQAVSRIRLLLPARRSFSMMCRKPGTQVPAVTLEAAGAAGDAVARDEQRGTRWIPDNHPGGRPEGAVPSNSSQEHARL